jgi:PAS domain S-box-containing protein
MNFDFPGSNEKLRSLFDVIANGIATYSSTDGQHFVLSAMNKAGEQMSEVRFQDIAGKEVREVFPGVVEMGLYDVFKRVWVSGTFECLSSALYGDQRISRYYENCVYKISDTELAVVYNDITAQKSAREELQRREEQMRVLFESSRAGIILVSPSGEIILANNRMAEMLGYSMEELLRTRYPDHLHPDQRTAGDDRMRKLIAGEIDHVATERHFIRKDGGELWGYLSGRRHVDAAGNFISLVGHITDISELKRSETAVRESEARYRTLVDNIPLGVSFIDRDYRVVMTNKTLADMFGHPAEWFKGKFCYEVFEKRPETCSHCPGAVCMTTGLLSHAYTTGVRDDGSRFDVHIQTAPLMGDNQEPYGFIEVAEDITERKRADEERLRLEQQLLHAQKLESLGVLAGGIAHDFNNILMAIMGNADLALMRINRESPAVENLRRIENAAAQAADLAKQMLAYSGKGRFVIENINLNLLLEEMLHMLEVSISKKAVLRFNPTRILPPVEADATQMRQIIMNLVINASEAIGETSGIIAITTGCMDCDRSYLKDVWLDENITEGLYVYLEIADTGCGMDKETLAKVFDPFFTTKFTGRGLGMAAVLGIVRGHKGAIKVYSEAGKGTTFKILLPASGRPVEIFNGISHTVDWRGSGTVLLVDDEETVRGIGAEMLKELGFSTITANDGREAVAIFKETPDIAFVILDLTMPHMDGEQCFRELRQLKPNVKVIMSSGYNEQEVTQKFVGKGLAGFIQKPYKLSVLKEAIQKIDTLITQPQELC